MKIELEVPEIGCCRCNATAAIVPGALKRGTGPNAIVDSVGGSWLPAAMPTPAGWTEPVPGRKLCPACSTAYADGVQQLLAPVAPPPTGPAALPPGAQRMISTSASAARVVSGPIVHHAPPASRPTITSAPPPAAPVRPATATATPQRPQAVQHAPIANLPAISTPAVRGIAQPAERSSGVVVHGQSFYPSTEAKKADPIPGALPPAELEPLPNEALDPQQPPATKRAS